MRLPLKMSEIDREHLQELYDAEGVARDELPYTDEFERIWRGFQDRTFKNAEREQVYAALLKHTRSSTNAAKDLPPTTLNDEQLKQLKAVLARHAKGGKVLPYSDEFESARKEFSKLSSTELSEKDFWQAISRAHGAKRLPPRRTKAAAPKAQDDDSDDE